MRFPRSSGILLHPTSLPGRFGIGDLGAEAHRFVDFLHAAGQRIWQVLPLTPTGYGDSPYQSFSAFAGNPFLVSPERLVEDGLLRPTDLEGVIVAASDRVDYGVVIPQRWAWLEQASGALASNPALEGEFDAWRAAQPWLADYSLFSALKDAHGGRSWEHWDDTLRQREPASLTRARHELHARVRVHEVAQWLFHRQWAQLRAHAHSKGIAILGDAPIFVAHDSADVWSRPELFFLDDASRPSVVAGVPPDYFSETGQLWGNPLYRWDRLADEGYAWWIERLRTQLTLVDRVRLDHFIGFHNYFEIPADAPDARKGRWVPGPGSALFDALETALGPLPILAEDLGEVSPEVFALRDRHEFPGMRVLTFAFGSGSENPFLPHRFETAHCAAYTGSHDNDPVAGWWATASDAERDHVRSYLARDGSDIAWDLLRLGSASVADSFVAQMQDVLALGSDSRMNLPGRASGNWQWRLISGQASPELAERLRALTGIYGR